MEENGSALWMGGKGGGLLYVPFSFDYLCSFASRINPSTGVIMKEYSPAHEYVSS
jgi:hypothetical protein